MEPEALARAVWWSKRPADNRELGRFNPSPAHQLFDLITSTCYNQVVKLKICNKCGVEKPISEFVHKHGKAYNPCQVCKNTRNRELYKQRTSRSPERRAQIRKAVKQWRNKRKDALDISKRATPCYDCGIQYPHYVMDFDHRDPKTKEFNVSGAFRRGMSNKRLEAEIAKCDLVCSNCHRERTFGPKK